MSRVWAAESTRGLRLGGRRLLIREVLASDVDGFLRYMREEHYWRDLPIEPRASIAAPLEAGQRICERTILWPLSTRFRARS